MSMSNDAGEAHMSDQLGALRSDVSHLQSDVTDLKTEVRTTHQRLDALRDRLDQNTTFLVQRMDGVQADLRKEIAASTDTLRKENAASTGELRRDIASVKDSLAAAKVWAITTWFTLAGGLLLVIARAFKWI